jgi:hypothetical protein
MRVQNTKTYLSAFAAAVSLMTLIAPVGAASQTPVDISRLQIENVSQCLELSKQIDGRESGGQWLIGSGIDLFGLPNAPRPISNLGEGAFERVQCFNQAVGSNLNRVFVSTPSGSSCGWVDRSDLLDENVRSNPNAISNRRIICAVPRAMSFDQFCTELSALSDQEEAACQGVPAGLRAKGVLIGSTADEVADRFQFFSAPRGGEQLDTKTFFSVLEIHDIAAGPNNSVMVLVGDGEGEMFGWIDVSAIELWPTRMGLFYDAAGRGEMFQRRRDLIQNWRRGQPDPDVTSGLTDEELNEYVHGPLQLLSYPIIRTVTPQLESSNGRNDVPFHEVIFLGQTGEGSASQLMSEADFANRLETLQQVNLMIVMDTTESMRSYLPLVREGVADFIADYQSRISDPSNRLPDVRIAVYAYSDFESAGAIELGDPISTALLMPPTRIDADRDLSALLRGISAHQGLDDASGLREEAALEAVVQLSGEFERGQAWFEDGPRIIIHMADHGSRSSVDVEEILGALEANRTFYLPLAIITEDESESSNRARHAFANQAVQMLAPLVDQPTEDDVARVDLLDFEETTAVAVVDQLNLVVNAVVSFVQDARGTIVGDQSSRSVEDIVSSRIDIGNAIGDQFGINGDAPETVVQASTAFAPLLVERGGLVDDIDWTYTIALDPQQARFLTDNFTSMCGMAGSPEQSQAFKALIVGVAEAFSGDIVESDDQIRAILSDMRDLPGSDQSFLSQPPQVLLDRADSTDPVVIDGLRRDVCWISYHMSNARAHIYARPDQLRWSGREFRLAPGEQVTAREYSYKPVIGAETIYFPTFFFVLPSIVEGQADEPGEDTCIFC